MLFINRKIPNINMMQLFLHFEEKELEFLYTSGWDDATAPFIFDVQFVWL